MVDSKRIQKDKGFRNNHQDKSSYLNRTGSQERVQFSLNNNPTNNDENYRKYLSGNNSSKKQTNKSALAFYSPP
jgi:hypothetical protein